MKINGVCVRCTSEHTFSHAVAYTFTIPKKSKIKVQRAPQSQAAALPRHQEEEETDKIKQAQIEQTYEKQ